jgi:tRNA (cmo5U34)-methyltransferase
MIGRSVPSYHEMVTLAVRVALEYLKPHSGVCDLGCSTATTLLKLAQSSPYDLTLTGVDNSQAMLEQARSKCEAFEVTMNLIEGDILTYPLPPVQSVIFSLFTLQFIRPLQREGLVKKIYDALDEDGIFIFAEKVISPNKRLDEVMINLYHEYKESAGYTKTQISQKRQALENVLVPYSVKENEQMVFNAGFSTCEILFKYNNFALFIATK